MSRDRQGDELQGNIFPNTAFMITATRCLNDECRQATVELEIVEHGSAVFNRRLIPSSTAKPQPEFIPEVLRKDYYEACGIRDLSPKASATLARRCLQGMIRDFCGIAEATLDKEIKKLRARVDEGTAPSGVTIETVEAIDHVRSIGNIGAHMEKNIDLIIDIEPEEAQILIGLVETLFEEWYVARESRRAKLAALRGLAEAKKEAIDTGRAERAASASE